jgi:3-isopropylmalate dehydrogenase
MKSNTEFEIAIFPGDGIGVEVMDAALAVLAVVQKQVGGFSLNTDTILSGGAAAYRDTGVALSDEALKQAGEADAILFGAMGLPDVRYPDGTEIAPQLDMRFHFELYAGVRPVKAVPGSTPVLSHPRAGEIDLVIIRESTEGLFASRGKGVVENDEVARDTMVITRQTSQRLFDFAFNLARRRKQQGRPGKVTCVDKANVFTSMAFFRKIFDERAALFLDAQDRLGLEDLRHRGRGRKPGADLPQRVRRGGEAGRRRRPDQAPRAEKYPRARPRQHVAEI